MIDTTCAAAIRRLAAGEIIDTRLPASSRLDEASAAVDGLARARDATGTLGPGCGRVRWRAIDAGIAGARLRLWHDGTRVLAAELEAPRLARGWDAVRAALGAPDARLHYWDDVVLSRDGHWVYPARGLAVFTRLAATEVARVVVFSPTTIGGYRVRLARALRPPRELDEP
jgi:hypothetical protein